MIWSGVVVMFFNFFIVEIGIGVVVLGMVILILLSLWIFGKGDFVIEVYDDSNGVVVFMSGVYFFKKWLRVELKLVVGINV